MHTLHQLAQLFLDAVPTVLIFLLLHFYLRAVLYRPLQRTLAERHQRTTGVLEQARARLAEAESVLAQVEGRLRAARLEAYERLASRRQAALAQRSTQLEQAREQGKKELSEAHQQLAGETQTGREKIQSAAHGLADEILRRLLGQAAAHPGVGA